MSHLNPNLSRSGTRTSFKHGGGAGAQSNRTSNVTFARRTSSGRYVSLSRDDLDGMSDDLNAEYLNYTVQIPPTPDNQPMVDPSVAVKAEEQYVSNSLFTGGFNSVTRAHLMDKVIDSEATHPQMAGAKGSACSVEGCDGKVMRDERGEDILPCECNYKICRECYFDYQKDGGVCPGCKEVYRVGDLEEQNEAFRNAALPLPGPTTVPAKLDRRMSVMRSGKSLLMRSQTGDFDHNRWLFETKGTYGYGNAFWPKEGVFNDASGDGITGNLTDLSDRPWKPLTRKLKIPAGILSPYRLLIFLRMFFLALFLTWRVRHPNNDAIWLWGMSIVCEIWFAFSWLLDVLPKLCPINRSTDLNVLKEKFEQPNPDNPLGPSDLPGVDVFVSTADPEKEPPLVTANTILSILAADYPVDKLSCYVSDDGGALLTFEAMAEAASYADVWVPFCRKHNIEPRNPDSYFNTKGDPTKNKLRADFVKDRRRVKREYDEFKVRINGLPDSIRRRSDAYNAREEMKAMKLVRENGTDPVETVKVLKATWMADGTHWPGTWTVSNPEHSRGDHAGIIQVMLKPPSSEPLTGCAEDKILDFTDVDIRLRRRKSETFYLFLSLFQDIHALKAIPPRYREFIYFCKFVWFHCLARLAKNFGDSEASDRGIGNLAFGIGMDLQRENRRVGIVYDEGMCKHARPFGKDHPENPHRIKVIWDKLCAAGLVQRCVRVNAREASGDELSVVHSRKHVQLMTNISSAKYDKTRDKLAKSFNSIYFNRGSSQAALLAAGSVLQISEKVALGELNAGVAVVRPPGHHAEANKPMGFCLFNNVAVAAQHLVHERPELGIHKVLIVDWDVHHGNGTQKMFWTDPQVLYFSVHRFDSGAFYPGGDDGNYKSIGEGLGAGYNINVPWEQGNCGDPDYLAVWDHILIPVAKSYNPDIVLISGGFDAALGDPLGGCRLTPYGYSLMTQKLMEFAGGKIVLALEGGYNLESLADSFAACVEALLADKPISSSSVLFPFESTWDVIRAVRKELSSFWPALNEDLPLPKLIKDDVLQSFEKLSVSSSDGHSESGEEFAEAGKITVSSTVISSPSIQTVGSIIQPLTELKLDDDRHDNNGTPQSVLALNCYKELPLTVVDEAAVPSISCSKDCNESTIFSTVNAFNSCSWRQHLCKTHIWYACYGSNMWKRRFLCYIEGGKVEGMAKHCIGSVDKTPPQDMQWKVVPHRMFFGRSYTETWGSGGVAFLHPSHRGDSKAHVCLYKITLEQFNDLLLQENNMSLETVYPLVDSSSVDAFRNENHILEVIEGSWYGTILYLGMEGGLPILSITCSISDIEKFKHGQLLACPPSSKYANVLLRGLVDGGGLSEADAIAYIDGASKLSLL